MIVASGDQAAILEMLKPRSSEKPRRIMAAPVIGAVNIRYGMRRPQRVRVRSDAVEMIGLRKKLSVAGIEPRSSPMSVLEAPCRLKARLRTLETACEW